MAACCPPMMLLPSLASVDCLAHPLVNMLRNQGCFLGDHLGGRRHMMPVHGDALLLGCGQPCFPIRQRPVSSHPLLTFRLITGTAFLTAHRCPPRCPMMAIHSAWSRWSSGRTATSGIFGGSAGASAATARSR